MKYLTCHSLRLKWINDLEKIIKYRSLLQLSTIKIVESTYIGAVRKNNSKYEVCLGAGGYQGGDWGLITWREFFLHLPTVWSRFKKNLCWNLEATWPVFLRNTLSIAFFHKYCTVFWDAAFCLWQSTFIVNYHWLWMYIIAFRALANPDQKVRLSCQSVSNKRKTMYMDYAHKKSILTIFGSHVADLGLTSAHFICKYMIIFFVVFLVIFDLLFFSYSKLWFL